MRSALADKSCARQDIGLNRNGAVGMRALVCSGTGALRYPRTRAPVVRDNRCLRTLERTRTEPPLQIVALSGEQWILPPATEPLPQPIAFIRHAMVRCRILRGTLRRRPGLVHLGLRRRSLVRLAYSPPRVETDDLECPVCSAGGHHNPQAARRVSPTAQMP